MLARENNELMAELSEAQVRRENQEADRLLGRQDFKYRKIVQKGT